MSVLLNILFVVVAFSAKSYAMCSLAVLAFAISMWAVLLYNKDAIVGFAADINAALLSALVMMNANPSEMAGVIMFCVAVLLMIYPAILFAKTVKTAKMTQ